MFINDDLINYLKNSYLLGGNCIYITDLDNVKGLFTSSYEKFDNPISKKLLRLILDVELSSNSESFTIINGKDNIIPIFEDNSLNIDWNAQIILPIWLDDHIQGTLIFTNFHKTFNLKHLEFAKITQNFVKKLLLDELNKKYKEETENEED